MAISTRVITMRQGSKADFQSSKMLSGELAVINDAEELHFSPKTGKSIRVATENDLKKVGNTVDDALSETSTNPVQNKVITKKINQLSGQISNQSGKGLSDTAITLLITILRSMLSVTDQSANITQLETELRNNSSGGGSNGGDSGGNDTEEITITQTGTILAINGVSTITKVTQTGTVLALA